MELIINNTYLLKEIDSNTMHTVKIIRKSTQTENKYKLEVLASTSLTEGSLFWFSTDEDWFEDCSCELISGEAPEIKINMDPELRALFIELALSTKDEKWFMELTKEVKENA